MENYQATEKLILASVAITGLEVLDDPEQPCRMRKKVVQQGRSERRGESYSVPYVEPLSDARTPLAAFFRILLLVRHRNIDFSNNRLSGRGERKF